MGLIPLISIAIIVITGMLCHHAISRERYFRVKRRNTDVAGASKQEAFSLSRLYMRMIVIQAFLYSGVFLAVYALYYIQGFILFAGIVHTPAAFSIVLYTLFPLGVFFNILVYTRPSVVTLHRRYSEYSWLRALWMVLKAGGEMPDERSLCEGLPISQLCRDVDRDDIGCEDAPVSIGCENSANTSVRAHEALGNRSEQDCSYEKGHVSVMVPDDSDEEECSEEMTFSQLGLT